MGASEKGVRSQIGNLGCDLDYCLLGLGCFDSLVLGLLQCHVLAAQILQAVSTMH